MAVTPLNPEIKILDFIVYAAGETGDRKLGMHYAWWDAGVPTKRYFEWNDTTLAGAEETVNSLIGHANDDYDVAHEV